MIQTLFSHWATYLFLAWAVIVVIVNLWPRKKKDAPGAASPVASRHVTAISARPFAEEMAPGHRQR
jgi:hypothetical protein